jgi:hypothetical protein
MAIKNAREMALIPYANRVTQQRNKRDGGGGERSVRADGPPPRPTAPPPTRAGDEELGDETFDDTSVNDTSTDFVAEEATEEVEA